MNLAKTVVILSMVAAALVACSRDDDASPAGAAALSSDAGVLAYVPADTPYVFATPAPMPEDVLDKLEANADSLYGSYQTVIAETLKGLEEEQGADAEETSIVTLIGELVGLMQSDELRAAGIPRSPQVAFYGVGMLPVLRVQLDDADRFDAKIAEVAANSDVEMQSADVGGEAYRYAGDADARIVVATIDDFGVVAIVPSALSDEQLQVVLGIDEPSESVADSGALEQLAERYGFGPYALGYIDIAGLFNIFLDPAEGINAELLSMMDYDASDLSAACRDEFRQASLVVPRLASGYTTVSTSSMSSNTIFEVRNDLATSLMTLSAPVPGMGVDHGGFGSFGMSLDLVAAREFYEARLDALETDPFECEHFAALQAGLEQGRAALNQPLPPIVYGFKGFVAVVDTIDGFDIANQRPPEDVEARILLANDNAAGLLAMGAMFSPQLASLELEPNGEPVPLDVPPFTDGFEAAFVAMTDGALGIAVGEGTDAGLKTLLESDAGDPPPFMSMTLDGARYYKMMSDIVDATADLPNPDGSPKEASPELQEAVSQAMTGFGDFISRIQVDVTFTENGVEMPTKVTLAD
ncbi:MAG: hypothetical protein AAF417_18085 [Pseudomonadota bacterium]